MGREVRYYQAEAKEAVLKGLKRGVKRQLLLMPGGTGKTFTTVNIVSAMGRKLWITHEESLMEQSAIALLSELDLMSYEDLIYSINEFGGLLELIRYGDKHDIITQINAQKIYDNIGIIKADLFNIDKPIVMASAQTLHNRLYQIPIDHFKVVVADECDLFLSRTFRMPLDYFEFDLLLGLTATPYRSDNVLMTDVFDEIIYEYTLEQAVKDGYLCELNAIVIKTSTDLDDVHTLGGDFNTKELAEKVNNPVRNNLIVNKYLEYSSGQQFICFGADVEHVIDLCEAFNEKGIKTHYVVSDKDKMVEGTDRKTIVNAYKNGEIVGLVNFNIFSAGFDVPDTGTVILACPTKSKRKFLQQLFRVTRLKSQSFVDRFGQIGTILDVVDGTSKHNIINTRELDKGKDIQDRVFTSSANKKLLEEAREARERAMEVSIRKEDKKVQLLPMLNKKLSFSSRMSEPATEAQLNFIASLGYNIKEETYTKRMISEILDELPAKKEDLAMLKAKGFDISGPITRGQASYTLWVENNKLITKK